MRCSACGARVRFHDDPLFPSGYRCERGCEPGEDDDEDDEP